MAINSETYCKEEIRPITLHKGLDSYQTAAVIDSLSSIIQHTFSIYLKESHFPYGATCSNSTKNCKKQNLNFNINFEAASVDLNEDGLKDVLVRLENSLLCGSGGCHTHILVNRNGIWQAFGSVFGASNINIRDTIKNGFQVIFYEAGCKTINGQYKCNEKQAIVTKGGTYQ